MTLADPHLHFAAGRWHQDLDAAHRVPGGGCHWFGSPSFVGVQRCNSGNFQTGLSGMRRSASAGCLVSDVRSGDPKGMGLQSAVSCGRFPVLAPLACLQSSPAFANPVTQGGGPFGLPPDISGNSLAVPGLGPWQPAGACATGWGPCASPSAVTRSPLSNSCRPTALPVPFTGARGPLTPDALKFGRDGRCQSIPSFSDHDIVTLMEATRASLAPPPACASSVSTSGEVLQLPVQSSLSTQPPADTACMGYPNGVEVRFADFSSSATAAGLNQPFLERMADVLERGELARIAVDVYNMNDRQKRGYLAWSGGEIFDFVAQVFQHFEFSAPSEAQIYEVYTKFDTRRDMLLEEDKCHCLVDAMFRAILTANRRRRGLSRAFFNSPSSFPPGDTGDVLCHARAETRRLQRELAELRMIEACGGIPPRTRSASPSAQPVEVQVVQLGKVRSRRSSFADAVVADLPLNSCEESPAVCSSSSAGKDTLSRVELSTVSLAATGGHSEHEMHPLEQSFPRQVDARKHARASDQCLVTAHSPPYSTDHSCIGGGKEPTQEPSRVSDIRSDGSPVQRSPTLVTQLVQTDDVPMSLESTSNAGATASDDRFSQPDDTSTFDCNMFPPRWPQPKLVRAHAENRRLERELMSLRTVARQQCREAQWLQEVSAKATASSRKSGGSAPPGSRQRLHNEQSFPFERECKADLRRCGDLHEQSDAASSRSSEKRTRRDPKDQRHRTGDQKRLDVEVPSSRRPPGTQGRSTHGSKHRSGSVSSFPSSAVLGTAKETSAQRRSFSEQNFHAHGGLQRGGASQSVTDLSDRTGPHTSSDDWAGRSRSSGHAVAAGQDQRDKAQRNSWSTSPPNSLANDEMQIAGFPQPPTDQGAPVKKNVLDSISLGDRSTFLSDLGVTMPSTPVLDNQRLRWELSGLQKLARKQRLENGEVDVGDVGDIAVQENRRLRRELDGLRGLAHTQRSEYVIPRVSSSHQ